MRTTEGRDSHCRAGRGQAIVRHWDEGNQRAYVTGRACGNDRIAPARYPAVLHKDTTHGARSGARLGGLAPQEARDERRDRV